MADSSYGIWEATTNLLPNGSFETNVNSWGANFGAGIIGASVTRVTDWFKFGGASMRVIGTQPNDSTVRHVGASCNQVAVSPSTVYAASAWVKTIDPSVPVGAGFGYNLRIDWYTSGSVYINSSAVTTVDDEGVSGTRLTTISTSPSNAAFAAVVIYVYTNAPNDVIDFRVDAVQLEQKSIATPYVKTDGASASRTAGRIQAPATLLSSSQMWNAFRIRPEWIYNVGPALVGGNPVLFNWQTDPTNRMNMSFQAPPGGLGFTCSQQSTANGPVTNIHPAIPFVAGQALTVVGMYTPTTLNISVNGSPFQVADRISVVTPTDTLFDIGSRAGAQQVSSEILWYMCGKGVLTNADVVALAALGDSDPLGGAIPPAALLSAIFPMKDNNYRLPG